MGWYGAITHLRRFDGSIYARAYTTFTSDLDEADITQLAQMLYNAVSQTVLYRYRWRA